MTDTDIHLLPGRGNRSRILAWAILILAPFAFGMLALWIGQDANWDFRNYHWYNAYALLNGRDGFDILPSQTPYFYSPLLDVPFYLLATHVPARMAGFALGWVQGLNFILLFMLAYASLLLANPRLKVLVCAGLGALAMLGGGGIAELGTTFYDNITSLGIFLSALLVVRHAERLLASPLRDAIRLALLFGIPAGFVMGLKLPAVIFCIGLCFAFFGIGGPWTRRFLLSFAFGLGVLVGATITYGYWGWFLQTHYGNPFFPFFNAIFKSPLMPPMDIRDTKFTPQSLRDFVFFPFLFAKNPRLVGEIDWRDWRLPMLYALLPAALALRLFFGRTRAQPDSLTRTSAARYLLWVAVIAYFVWAAGFGIYRYVLPLEMLAPLLIVFAVGMLPLRLVTRGLVAGALLLVVAFSVQPGNWSRRATWLDHFVEAKIPPLGDTSDLMILMAGFAPYSHLVPLFPAQIPFVRIQSNFIDTDSGWGYNAVIRARVAAHKGRFLMLIPPWQRDLARKALQPFHLSLLSKPCQTVVDRLYDDQPMLLCRIVPAK